ncbi:hypothetical protein GCM10009760_52790 [Kitasatospora kazusensis]|uniref:Uncharacterized protein n=1 Tax=Kitasatospora kazusensis TaxID=407974 RepID=A0ABN3A634_9ACTN
MGLIAPLELVEPVDLRTILAGGEPAEPSAVRLVHAAPSDPDIPGDPGPATVCGGTPPRCWSTTGSRNAPAGTGGPRAGRAGSARTVRAPSGPAER